MGNKRRLASLIISARRRNTSEPVIFTAAGAKIEFDLILEKVFQGERVVITKHGEPKAILMSMDDFNILSGSTGTKLNSLNEEFDAMLARMQSAKSRAAMEAAFSASPEDLGRASVSDARLMRRRKARSVKSVIPRGQSQF